MNKISVIIPVYNSEAYIEQCVQSLIGQTYQNWEALLIDDGSTDRSPELCESLSRADSRIKAYHQEHKGVSAARNYGLDIAAGEYVYFLDSDDAIHPLLFEEMIRQIEEHHVEMVFCNFIWRDDRQMDAVLAKASPQDKRPQWQIGDGEESERWFHIDHAAVLCLIIGMMSRELIGTLRFDETLPFGEDTIFKYELFRKQVRTVYSSRQWYYYRRNPRSACQRDEFLTGDVYTEKTVRMRDSEHRDGNMRYALAREIELSCQLRQRYERCRELGDEEQCKRTRATALRECGHPLFRFVDPFHKGLFHMCFKCYPLYVPVSRALNAVWTVIHPMESFKAWMQTKHRAYGERD